MHLAKSRSFIRCMKKPKYKYTIQQIQYILQKMEGEGCGRHTIREVWNRNKLFLLLNSVKIKVLSRNSKGVKTGKTGWQSIGSEGLQWDG